MAEKTQLVGILNTEVYRQKAMNAKGADEKSRYESMALYTELQDSMRKATFREVMEFVLKQNENEAVAVEIRDYLQQHNGTNALCEVRVYNQDNTRKKKENDTKEVLSLDDKVSAYIDARTTDDGTMYECLDMTAKLYVDCGK